MASEQDLSPGDITVSVVPSGFMVGRMLPARGRGVWWEMLNRVPSLREAVQGARTLAIQHKVRAWFQKGKNEYRDIPLDDSEFVLD